MKCTTKHFLLEIASATTSFWQKRKLLLFALFCALFSVPAFSQDAKVTVNGVVKDSTGTGMGQVTVSEKGKKNATTTKDDGSFTITVASSKSVLVFTSIGYSGTQITVGDQTNITIGLKQATNSDLGEVVVVGYGTKKKESITGAVSSISAKDMDRVHGGSTVSSGLAGKIPGVTFKMPDGRPGASANIQIRNMGNPLYVIDGIQQDAGQFNNLAPNDIETITVLKDGSAAIYGVRAANGVVVVTTKQGKRNSRNTINVDAYTGWQNWSRFTDVLTDSYDYQRYRAEAEMNRYKSTNITADVLEKWKNKEPGYDKSFDWKDFIIKKNAPLYSANVNFTGGTDKLNYYVSGTRLFQNSVLGREYKFGRTNIQSNINATIANGLKIGLMINGRQETRDNPGVPGGDDYWLARFAILRNTPLERPYANDNPEYLNDIKHNETNWAYLNYKNAGRFHNDWRVLQTNATVEWAVPFIKGLSFRGLYSYFIADFLYNNHEYTYDTYTYTAADDKYTRTGGSINPWREREQIKQINQASQGQVNYNNSFGKHTIGATFVAERIKNQRLRNWIHSVPTTNVLPLIYFATADQYQDSDDRQARIGYVGRISYSYDNKYFVDASARRDASFLFPKDNRVGYFPNVGVSWILTEESFIKKIIGRSNILSSLKVRASYGELGDDGDALGLGAFSYIPGYNYNAGISILNGNPVITSSDRGAPTTNITWLKSKMTDIGIDFSLFNGKINGTFDYFNRKRSGLRDNARDVLIPGELGYDLPNENQNTDQQYGSEGSLNYNGKIGKIMFQVGGNLSYTRSKFISRVNDTRTNSWDKYRNSDVDRYTRRDWGYTVTGQFQTQEEINNYPVNIDGQGNRTLLPGDLIYKDFNGDNKIDDYDQRAIGYGGGAQPNINFGFNVALAYKGIEFHADFSGAAGYTWFQNWETRWAFQNDGNLNTMFEDRWHRADIYDLNSAWIPGKYPALRYNEGGHSNYNRNSTYWAHNVSYIRARTLELAYSLPQSILSKVKVFQKARFYVNAYNLFSIDNVHQFGIDPEINDDNGLQFPQNKFVNVGVNLSL